MIGRFVRWLADLALTFVVLAMIAALLAIASLLSTPRGAAVIRVDAARPVAADQLLLGAPTGEAIPRTRGIEPATTLDPAHEAVGGAPLSQIPFGVGPRSVHREPVAVTPAPSPSPVPRPSPRPAVAPPAARAGTVGGGSDGPPPTATPRLQALPSDCRLPCYGIARSGPASWYGAGRGFYAAIPGYIAGTVVSVVVCTFPNGAANCHTFPVVTSCGCLRHTKDERVVDLSPEAFALFEPDLQRGLVRVTITVLR